MTCSCTIMHKVPGPFAGDILETVHLEDPDCPKHRPHTLNELRNLHQFEQSHDGDGYTEPYSTHVGCSCGVTYYAHMQHAGECGERCDPSERIEQDHAEHLLAMAVRARLARSRGGSR